MIDISLPADVADWMQSQAKAEGLTIDEFIEKALDHLIAKHEAAA
jgi:hypothetical protein